MHGKGKQHGRQDRKKMNSAYKRKLRKQKRDTLIANVLGFTILAAVVVSIFAINYQIILIRYGA